MKGLAHYLNTEGFSLSDHIAKSEVFTYHTADMVQRRTKAGRVEYRIRDEEFVIRIKWFGYAVNEPLYPGRDELTIEVCRPFLFGLILIPDRKPIQLFPIYESSSSIFSMIDIPTGIINHSRKVIVEMNQARDDAEATAKAKAERSTEDYTHAIMMGKI